MENGEWWCCFTAKTDGDLKRQLYEYKELGCIEFEEVPLLVSCTDNLTDPDDESSFRTLPSAFRIININANKVTDDLIEYLEY